MESTDRNQALAFLLESIIGLSRALELLTNGSFITDHSGNRAAGCESNERTSLVDSMGGCNRVLRLDSVDCIAVVFGRLHILAGQ